MGQAGWIYPAGCSHLTAFLTIPPFAYLVRLHADPGGHKRASGTGHRIGNRTGKVPVLGPPNLETPVLFRDEICPEIRGTAIQSSPTRSGCTPTWRAHPGQQGRAIKLAADMAAVEAAIKQFDRGLQRDRVSPFALADQPIVQARCCVPNLYVSAPITCASLRTSFGQQGHHARGQESAAWRRRRMRCAVEGQGRKSAERSATDCRNDAAQTL